jgi:hypothetical protein
LITDRGHAAENRRIPERGGAHFPNTSPFRIPACEGESNNVVRPHKLAGMKKNGSEQKDAKEGE